MENWATMNHSSGFRYFLCMGWVFFWIYFRKTGVDKREENKLVDKKVKCTRDTAEEKNELIIDIIT